MTRRIPHSAMVLAAGYGKRMLPLTAHMPKPLLEVGGRTMLDRVLDHLKADGIENIVVNASYCGDQIAAHCAARTDLALTISQESEPLETGGGVKQALPLLGRDPCFVINADLPWRDGAMPALQRLRQVWNPDLMDILLLTMPRVATHGFSKGDFQQLPDGRLRRVGGGEMPDVFIGVMIVKPALYDGIAETCFSNNRLFDAAEVRGRLYGLTHDSTCYHVGTPPDLARANGLLASGQGWGTGS